jgi:hypothetical protein
MKNSDDILSSLVTLSNPFLGDAGIIEASPAPPVLPARVSPIRSGQNHLEAQPLAANRQSDQARAHE